MRSLLQRVSNIRLLPSPHRKIGATEGRIITTSQQAGQPAFGISDVIAKVSQVAFGKPLVTNVLRGHVAEAIIALALEPD